MIIALLKGTARPLRLHAPPAPYHHLVFFVLCPPVFRQRPQATVLEIYGCKFAAHYPRGDTSTFPKILGVRAPWGNFFPKFFFKIRTENIRSHGPDPGKNKQKKKIWPRTPLGPGRSLKGARITFFEF